MGLVNRVRAGRSGFEYWMRQKSYIFFKSSMPEGPPNLIFSEYWDFFPGGGGGKAARAQFDHSLLSSAEVNTAWRYKPPSSICLHILVRERFVLGVIEMLILGVLATSIIIILSYLLVPKPLNMYIHKTATLPVSLHGDVTFTLKGT